MNGQTARLEICRYILEHCRVQQIVETGTYRGATSEWFAQFGLPLVTIEIQERFEAFSSLRLSRFTNAEVRLGDSVAILHELACARSLNSAIIFFYLDAHWLNRLPLADELNLIVNDFRFFVVVIDDFAVPYDDGYGFDDYGPGKALTLDYLKSTSAGRLPVFFPNVRSEWETGHRRGCVVLCSPDLEEALQQCPLLSQWHGAI
jgi:hypothetical protein